MTFTIQIITLLPQFWEVLRTPGYGLVGRAFEKGMAELVIHDLREFGHGVHRSVDDTPFGGGPGMLLRVGPVHQAIQKARARATNPVYLLSPAGTPFKQPVASELAETNGFTLVCGRYEGFDERIRYFVDGAICLMDAVLSGGDPAALCVVDAAMRLRPGVLGNECSITDESFTGTGLEHPQFTRPVSYEGYSVPEVLRSGDHGAIMKWKVQAAQGRTEKYRPSLLEPTNEDTD
ncbi:MAG: tRNA (guanosine(37)-N1)-methyltransferase TrmD [Myxococcota bacterium]|nr:tRNA (guanosine(37)-N1)-methyltransferase TrmD [Myxococcota bacterium]